MKRIPLIAVLAGLTFGAGNALAAPDGAKLYQEKTCVACHGKDAKKPLTPAIRSWPGRTPPTPSSR
jgi:cytochrome c